MLIPNPAFRPRPVDPEMSALPAAPQPRPAPPRRPTGLDFGEVLALLRRALPWCLLGGIALGAAGAWFGTLLPRAWTAEGLLTIDTQRVAIPEFQTVSSERTVEPWGARSEAKVLTSRAMVEAAVRASGLDRHPAFAPRPPLVARLAKLPGLPASLAAWLDEFDPAREVAPETGPGELVERVQRRLKVVAETQSYAIEVSFTAPDPVLAADFVNALMRAYVTDQIAGKREATLQANLQLRRRADELYADLQGTRARLRALEASGRSVEAGAGGSVTAQALVALRAERRELDAQRAAIQSDLDQIAGAAQAGRYNVLNEALVTPRLRTLWESEAGLQRQLADSAVQFGPRHPRMVALQRELGQLREQIQGEVVGVRRDLERRLASLRARASGLDEQIRAAEREAAASAAGRAGATELAAEAESKQKLYDLYRQRYEQTLASLEAYGPDARIVSEAAVPTRPSSPGPTLLGAVGSAIGVLGTLGLAFARQRLDQRVGTVDDAVEATGLPALGGIRTIRRGLRRRTSLPDLVVERPAGDVAETVRALLARLQPAGVGRVPRILAVTSPLPGDGKSSLVAAAARVAAADGLRVLAIDGDLRRPTLAGLIGAARFVPLDAFLAGAATLDELVVQDGRSSAEFVLARPLRQVTRALLEGRPMANLLALARSRYDLVLLDTPPVMRVVDPLVLGRQADGTVVTVAARGADRATVRATIARLEDAGCAVLGLVVSRVGNRQDRPYVYGGYGNH
jgi:capsular exopolysaccharide synthesis family protein